MASGGGEGSGELGADGTKVTFEQALVHAILIPVRQLRQRPAGAVAASRF
jgi:hypothetical protein